MKVVAEPKHDDSFRDSISTIGSGGKRAWIFPKKPSGNLYRLRTIFTLVYLAVFFTLPFIKVNEEPLFLLNILERKFVIFGLVFWPQDFFLFVIAMLTFMVFIILFTVVFGRVFCGWACPQTVFMEMVFRRIEYWIEGDAVEQKQLAKLPWNAEKLRKRGLKLVVFFVISFIIANFFLSYIIGMDHLLDHIQNPSKSVGTLFSLLLFTGVFYFIFTWFREQACIVVCPYGRLQGVLLDRNSIVVAYDHVRGEPRGKFHKNEVRAKGDCVDCLQCVKVCPTGIDIRNGTQLECVNCTACIDACDHMMESLHMPKGLVRYASESGIANKQPLTFTRRILAYTIVLSILLTAFLTLLITRSDIDATVMRTPGMLYQKQEDGRISNLYNIKLVNKTHKKLPVELKLESMDGEIKMVGKDILVDKEAIGEGIFFILLKGSDIKERKVKLKIGVYSNGKLVDRVSTNFISPIAASKS